LRAEERDFSATGDEQALASIQARIADLQAAAERVSRRNSPLRRN
jgi:hypothetical protein